MCITPLGSDIVPQWCAYGIVILHVKFPPPLALSWDSVTHASCVGSLCQCSRSYTFAGTCATVISQLSSFHMDTQMPHHICVDVLTDIIQRSRYISNLPIPVFLSSPCHKTTFRAEWVPMPSLLMEGAHGINSDDCAYPHLVLFPNPIYSVGVFTMTVQLKRQGQVLSQWYISLSPYLPPHNLRGNLAFVFAIAGR